MRGSNRKAEPLGGELTVSVYTYDSETLLRARGDKSSVSESSLSLHAAAGQYSMDNDSNGIFKGRPQNLRSVSDSNVGRDMPSGITVSRSDHPILSFSLLPAMNANRVAQLKRGSVKPHQAKVR